ncbi:MAG TPA: BatD family protein, partial [Flavisolibacter sp.]|nr:BatD family protein [Flavisolibacter sp.]
MKKLTLLIYSFLLTVSALFGQVLKTIVPNDPVVVGTAFQVQFIILYPTDVVNTIPPDFKNFRLVSGPRIYTGKTNYKGLEQTIENIAYTLAPTETGKLRIEGLTVSYKNKVEQKGKDSYVVAISPPKASFNTRSTYTDVSLYAPDSKTDLEKIVKNNLFIKTDISKTTCYEGEPVMVTYKLYSRLQSSSEAIKAPGLYGFSMIDMIDINEAHQSVETINGKVFNTYLLRQMQLYPMQPGELTIDPMHIQNDIEFDDTINKGQKIQFQKELASEPVRIKVKPLPENKPESFTGAVGQFSISAYLIKKDISLDQQGKLIVTVNGRGNFIQFGQPEIKRLKGIDLYDPLITDQLNKAAVPEEGKRTYEFNFAADSAGVYEIPSIVFSYFDINSLSFKTTATDPLPFNVIKATDNSILFVQKVKDKTINYTGLIIIILLSVLAILFSLKFKKGKPLKKTNGTGNKINYEEMINNLGPGSLNDKDFTIRLVKIISAYLAEKGDQFSKERKNALKSFGDECQLTIYSGISTPGKKEELKEKALQLVGKFQA